MDSIENSSADANEVPDCRCILFDLRLVPAKRFRLPGLVLSDNSLMLSESSLVLSESSLVLSGSIQEVPDLCELFFRRHGFHQCTPATSSSPLIYNNLVKT